MDRFKMYFYSNFGLELFSTGITRMSIEILLGTSRKFRDFLLIWATSKTVDKIGTYLQRICETWVTDLSSPKEIPLNLEFNIKNSLESVCFVADNEFHISNFSHTREEIFNIEHRNKLSSSWKFEVFFKDRLKGGSLFLRKYFCTNIFLAYFQCI